MLNSWFGPGAVKFFQGADKVNVYILATLRDLIYNLATMCFSPYIHFVCLKWQTQGYIETSLLCLVLCFVPLKPIFRKI